LVGGGDSILISTGTISLNEISDNDEFLDFFYYRLEEGDFSDINVVNEPDFTETLKTLLNQ
jgi:hypothetical protein